jgi:uncharacterized 2Fe-2S/4Fe-4S cluster protein (DUF4445 family)
VQIEAGNVHGPTKNEHLVLSAEQLGQNIRLACQLTPKNDLLIRVINTVSKPNWRDLPPDHLACTHSHHLSGIQSTETGYGLAVDVGTTHISLSLWDLEHSNRLFGRIGLNPQSRYGTDVVTRLIAAGESPEAVRRIARMPLDAIYKALLDMYALHNVSPREITRVSIVGNTPMLALLTETDPQILLQPRFWTQPVDCRLDDPQTWVSVMGIHPEAAIDVISPFAGFVGSDLLAGVLATGLTDHPTGLLIDFGTNSEIALWDGNTLRVTSAAGGPAFESCGIQCGMPAEAGAIYRIDQQQDSTGFHFQVIGGGEAKGLCGSGLVDLIAYLRSTGDLTPTGKFATPYARDGFVVNQNSSDIRLTIGDVDMLQRAKAAIGVGINTLLAKAKMKAEELSRICVCGAFGRHLNTRNAQLIGLLPDVPPERIELCGNTALAGCEHLLLSPIKRVDMESLRNRAVIVNLSQASDFETLFVENLYLQPLRVDET